MTKYEKWTIRLSFSAIIISIISIIVTIVIVIKFNPILLELKHAGRVTVAEKFLFDDDEKKGYQIELTNVGDMPINGTSIGIWAKDSSISLPEEKSYITLVPVTKFYFEKDGQRLYLDIPKTLGKGQKLSITILGIYFPHGAESHDLRVDISSSVGDAIKVSSFRGAGASGKW